MKELTLAVVIVGMTTKREKTEKPREAQIRYGLAAFRHFSNEK